MRGLPEYARLRHILTTYPATMGSDMRKIEEYSQALERFGQKDFYRVEELVAEELKNFQMEGFGERQLTALSGGQKRLVEVVKIMHAQADLALIDEPTNHMDYVAKKQFIDWMKSARQAMLIITHDRDVLAEVDRIVELRDGASVIAAIMMIICAKMLQRQAMLCRIMSKPNGGLLICATKFCNFAA